MTEKASNKNAGESVRPVCPKCKEPMRLWATGRTVKHYHCKGCAQSKLINKED